MMGGVVEEAMCEGKVTGLNPADCVKHTILHEKILDLPRNKIFLNPILYFSRWVFTPAVVLTEPPVEIYFHRRLS